MDPFGFVILVAILSAMFLVYLMEKVAQKRKEENVPLPDQYHPDKKVFNCYQRAYMNTVENFPTYLLLLFAGGQIFPIVSSIAGLVWIFGRFRYAWGYWTGDPAKRANGWPSYIGLLVLLVCSFANVLDRLGVVNL